ncbi:hypothetical protein, partial [Thermogutta sp.]|uniref:hypothetical protein n=1 Tax=Thermogutta sp. TaxID=1962930 RepID=UPI0032203D06
LVTAAPSAFGPVVESTPVLERWYVEPQAIRVVTSDGSETVQHRIVAVAPAWSVVAPGSIVELDASRYRAMKIHRYDLLGRPHHIEVELEELVT